MKKYMLILALTVICSPTFAQKQEDEPSGFRKDHVFLGGSLALGYGSATGAYGGSSFVIGANPEIGYTLADWIDAGLAFNSIFNSIKYFDGLYNIKQTSFNYGAGVFTRIHPFNGFFIQVQPEYNWIEYKQKNINTGATYPKQTVNAASFLVGAGYGQRVIGQTNFFTVLMFDLGTEKYSPYRDGYGNAVPIIRGGVNFYLKAKKKK